MPAGCRIIEGEYLRDLVAQPQAISDTVCALEESPPLRSFYDRLAAGEFQRIVLTGMGSSFYALHPLNLELINQGYTPLKVETSELIYYMSGLLDRKTLILFALNSKDYPETLVDSFKIFNSVFTKLRYIISPFVHYGSARCEGAPSKTFYEAETQFEFPVRCANKHIAGFLSWGHCFKETE